MNEIAAQIGVRGMGEVYRARGTKLDRDVAIKVLPASLNHPNIAAICGLEEADSTKALVMELIEGPTLAMIQGTAAYMSPEQALGRINLPASRPPRQSFFVQTLHS